MIENALCGNASKILILRLHCHLTSCNLMMIMWPTMVPKLDSPLNQYVQVSRYVYLIIKIRCVFLQTLSSILATRKTAYIELDIVLYSYNPTVFFLILKLSVPVFFKYILYCYWTGLVDSTSPILFLFLFSRYTFNFANDWEIKNKSQWYLMILSVYKNGPKR